MEINKNTVKGKWLEFKGEVQKAWGRLTDDELEATKGDVKSVGGLIQQKYGREQEGWRTSFDAMVDKYKDTNDEAVKSAKNQLRN